LLALLSHEVGNGFGNLEENFVRDFFGEGADLGQLAEGELLALCRLLQIRGILLEDTQLLLEEGRGEELRDANFADRAVTNKVAQSKDVRNNRLVVRLAEHKSHELADRREEHEHVIRRLLLVAEAAAIVASYQLLSYCDGDLVLFNQSLLVIFASRLIKCHS